MSQARCDGRRSSQPQQLRPLGQVSVQPPLCASSIPHLASMRQFLVTLGGDLTLLTCTAEADARATTDTPQQSVVPKKTSTQVTYVTPSLTILMKIVAGIAVMKKVYVTSLVTVRSIANQQSIGVSQANHEENVSYAVIAPVSSRDVKKHIISRNWAMHRSEGLEATLSIRSMTIVVVTAQGVSAGANTADQNSFIPFDIIMIGIFGVGVISSCWIAIKFLQRMWMYSRGTATRRPTSEASTQTASVAICVTAYGECYHWHPQCDALKDSRTTTLKRMCLRCDKFMKAA